MGSLRFLLFLVGFVLASPAVFAQFVGHNCENADREEYDYVERCTTFDRSTPLAPEAQANFESEIQALMYSEAAGASHRFSQCQLDLYQNITSGLQSGAEQMTNLQLAAWNEFNHIRGAIGERTEDLNRAQRSVDITDSPGFSCTGDPGCQAMRGGQAALGIPTDREIQQQNRGNRNQARANLHNLVARIALGNRPEMRDAMIDLANSSGQVSQEQFNRVWAAQVGVLSAQAQESVNFWAGPQNENRLPAISYTLDSDLREGLLASGQVEMTARHLGMQERSAREFICREKTYISNRNNREALITILSMVGGYGLARLAVRAGLRVAYGVGRGAQIARATQVSAWAAWVGVEANLVGMDGEFIRRSCMQPEFLAGTNESECTADSEYNGVLYEASAAACITSSVLAVVSVGVTAPALLAARPVVQTLQDGTRVTRNLPGIREVLQLPNNGGTITRHLDGMVVTERAGTRITEFPNDVRLTETPGQRVTEYPDRIVVTEKIGEFTETRFPDGTVERINSDGSRVTSHRDGTRVAVDSNGRPIEGPRAADATPESVNRFEVRQMKANEIIQGIMRGGVNHEDAFAGLNFMGYREVRRPRPPRGVTIYRHPNGSEIVAPTRGPVSINGVDAEALRGLIINRTGRYVHPSVADRVPASVPTQARPNPTRSPDVDPVTPRSPDTVTLATVRGLTEETRSAARESLRRKGIEEADYASFYSRENGQALASDLTPEERIFLFEHFAGVRLNDADAARLLQLHDIGLRNADGTPTGRGFGQYTDAEILEKGLGIRTLLRANGVTDQATILSVIERSLGNGILGRAASAAPAAGGNWFTRLFGGGGSTRADPPIPETARADYRSARQELLDPDGVSEQGRVGQTMSGSDLFYAGRADRGFQGTLDELITSGAFRDRDRYTAAGGYNRWWEEVTITTSKSPIAGLYGNVPTRRKIFWPKNMLEANGARNAEYVTSFTDYKVVVNQALENGVWVDKSIEAIGRNAAGEFIPMYYVRQGDRWVPARTFQGQPLRQACLQCHHHPSRPTVFTTFPYNSGGRQIHALDPAYQPFARQIVEAEGSALRLPTGAVTDTQRSSPYVNVVRRDAAGAVVAEGTPRIPPERLRDAPVGELYREAEEVLPNRGLTGEEPDVGRRRALNQARRVPREEGERLLIEAFGSADARRLIDSGFVQPRGAVVEPPRVDPPPRVQTPPTPVIEDVVSNAENIQRVRAMDADAQLRFARGVGVSYVNGSPRSQIVTRAFAQTDPAEIHSILRHGMTRAEVAAFRRDRPGESLPTQFSRIETDSMMTGVYID